MRRRSVASCLFTFSLLAAASPALAQPAPPPAGAAQPPVAGQPAVPGQPSAPGAQPPGAQPGGPAAPMPGVATDQATAPLEPRPLQVNDPALEAVTPAQRNLRNWREALTLVAARAPDVIIAVQEVARAEGIARQALAGALGSITAQGSVNHPIVPGDLFIAGLTGPEGRTRPAISTQSASLNASFPLFAPRAWYGYKTAQLSVEVAKLSVEDRQRVVLAAVANAVVNVVTAERVAEINRVGLRASLELLELTRRRAELGTGTRLDVVRAEQDVALARTQIVTADESLRQTREALGLSLGVSEAYGVEPTISLDEVASSLRAICSPGAADMRPDVRAARAQLEIAERAITDVKLSYVPTAQIGSSMDLSYQVQPGFRNFTWNIQALVTIPIWEGGARYGAMKIARAQVEQQRARMEATERSATVEQVQATRAIEVAEQARLVATQARDLAAETARLTRVAFEAGTATSFELVQAQQRLREAELQLALREFELVRARIAALLASSTCRY